MNNFYNLPKTMQWTTAMLLLIIGFLPALFIIERGYSQPIFYSLFILYIPIAQFAYTPLFSLTGVYKYYSPMLLGYMANDKQIDLHSGSGFDYLIVMRKYKSGVELRNKLLMYHIEGLLQLIQLIENKSIPETVNIVGTSYFFNDRTLSKIGFDVVNPSMLYRINLFVNFIDLTWMFSLSKGKFLIPKFWKATKASISGARLVESKKDIEDLYDKMKRRTTTL
jgi:hypothetical protein